jgi:predicted dehydrogenase
MKRYRTAIIGTGQFVEHHLNTIRNLEDRLELVAAVDVNEERVRAVCAENNIPAWYTSTPEMLEAIRPDLVQIITPPAAHMSLVVESLKAGAWVFCEKPLCRSLAEFDQIAQAEAASDAYVSTVFQWRFGSAAQHLRGLIEQGELGKPLVAVCNTLWYRTQDYYRLPWRSQWAAGAGGPTSTLGIHLMDLLLWLWGDWEEVHALLGTLDHNIEVEDVSMAVVRFANGAMGSIVNSAVSPRQETYLRLDFQKATVEVSALYYAANVNWRYSIPDGSPYTAELENWQTPTEDRHGNHTEQLKVLLDCMDRGEAPPVQGQEARRTLEFITALYKSGFTGQRVRRGSITPDDPFYSSLNGAVEKIVP